jgi:hypothetical protein
VRLGFFEEASDHCLLDVGRKDAQVMRRTADKTAVLSLLFLTRTGARPHSSEALRTADLKCNRMQVHGQMRVLGTSSSAAGRCGGLESTTTHLVAGRASLWPWPLT